MTFWKRLLVWLLPKWRFGRNPYRRYCRYCGQQQNLCGVTYATYTWWETVYPIAVRKPECDIVHSEAE
jgi:hypothetical protein